MFSKNTSRSHQKRKKRYRVCIKNQTVYFTTQPLFQMCSRNMCTAGPLGYFLCSYCTPSNFCQQPPNRTFHFLKPHFVNLRIARSGSERMYRPRHVSDVYDVPCWFKTTTERYILVMVAEPRRMGLLTQ